MAEAGNVESCTTSTGHIGRLCIHQICVEDDRWVVDVQRGCCEDLMDG